MQQKQCTKCGKVKPATTEYFPRNRYSKDGLAWQCKECANAYSREYRERNQERVRRHAREYYYTHREQMQATSTAWKKRNAEYVKEYKQRYREENREAVLASEAEYRRNNPKATKQRQRRWKRENRKHVLAYSRRYFTTARSRVLHQRRAARIRELPDTFTESDWQRALGYFNGCCAVCERPLRDLFGTHTAAMDHWIPLSSPDCPGTIPTNIIPLCHGEGGCNNSKSNNDPIEWLTQNFGKRQARTILKRIETYFQSLR